MHEPDSSARQQEPSPVTFRSIYDTEVSYVWRYLRHLGVPPRDLEDKVQDVFVALYRCWDRYDTSRPVRPWLTGIGFRVASDYRRKASNYREVIRSPVEEMDLGPGPEEEAARREAVELLLQALAMLDFDRRAMFVLHDMEGRTIPSIARDLEMSENTLYSRLRRARKQFIEAVVRLQNRSAMKGSHFHRLERVQKIPQIWQAGGGSSGSDPG